VLGDKCQDIVDTFWCQDIVDSSLKLQVVCFASNDLVDIDAYLLKGGVDENEIGA
jgi:hypothetical protein